MIRKTASRRRSTFESLEIRRLLCLDPTVGGHDWLLPPDAESGVHALPTDQSTPSLSGTPDSLAVPAYSSRPAASKKIYLDFNGHGSIDNWGGWWLFGGIDVSTTPAYDIDGDPSSFSTQELTNIQIIWKAVAENFSPFNVDVTTVEPSSLDGARVVIGGDGSWLPAGLRGASGIAWQGYFGREGFTDVNKGNVVFAFGPRFSPLGLAHTISHETGHTLNLYHHSRQPISTNEYAPGFIMGHAIGVTRWGSTSVHGTIATYRDGNVVQSVGSQDDLAVIAGKVGYRADDHGNTIATATTVQPTFAGSGISIGHASGVIDRNNDLDMFRYSHLGGLFDVEVLAAEYSRMLDPQIRLLNSTGGVVASSSSNNGSDGAGERITFNNLNAGTYFVEVRGSGNYGDVGQYRLTIRTGLDYAGFNDTMGTATELGLFGQTDAASRAIGFHGTASISDSLAGTDLVDYFKIKTPAHLTQLAVQLSGLTTNAGIALIDDSNANGFVDFGEIIASTPPSSNTQVISRTDLAGGKTYFVRVTRDGQSPSGNYTLRITADAAPSTLPPTVVSASMDPQPLRGGRTIYDSIDPVFADNVDYHRVTAEYDGLFSFYMTDLTNILTLTVGTDTNGNGLLESGEILGQTTVGAGTSFLQNIPVSAGQTLLLRVTPRPNPPFLPSNYSLQAVADYATGGNTTGSLVNAFDLTHRFAGVFYEYLDASVDFYDTFRIPLRTGPMKARMDMLQLGQSHRLEIIRDANFNNVVDPGEVVASGFTGQVLNHEVTPGANYFLRVSSTQFKFPSIGNYRVSFAMADAVGGLTPQNPQPIAPGPAAASVSGYMGFDPDEPGVTNLEDYYRFTLASRTRLDASIAGAGMGVQVGQLDATGEFRRIGGVGTYQGILDSLNVNLDPGTYLIRTYLPVGERQDQPSGGNYQLTFKTSAITDNVPPQVTATEFQYQVGPTGVIFTVSEDVFGSIDPSNVLVRNLATTEIITIGQTFYDPATRRIGYTFANRVAPDGEYRALLKAGSIRDAAGNALPANVSFDFHVLAGDANRDRRVNLADFNILAANFGGSPKTFSQGDFNYDGVVNLADFNILAARFGAVLGSDGQIAGTPGVSLPAFGEQQIGATDTDRSQTDEIQELLV